jgi:hypothetical protein
LDNFNFSDCGKKYFVYLKDTFDSYPQPKTSTTLDYWYSNKKILKKSSTEPHTTPHFDFRFLLLGSSSSLSLK